jgi:hypothetical protein
VKVWRYPWWLRWGLSALGAITVWGAFAATWPGVLKIYGYGAPLLCIWALFEAWRRRLVLTETHVASCDLLGRVIAVRLDDLTQIAIALRPGLTLSISEGVVIEVPRLLGNPRRLAAALEEAMRRRGVRIEK